jgi:16S rRNA (cytosine967-C5)-methyltransferase
MAGRTALQDRIRSGAARLTKPGGRVVYVTCSLLPEENQDRVNALLARRDDYRVLPAAAVWAETITAIGGPECPEFGDFLALTPDRHGTDGFFVAVLERSENAAEDGM